MILFNTKCGRNKHNDYIWSRMICSIWVVLLYQSSHWYAIQACGTSRQWSYGYSFTKIWKPDLLSLVFSLSMRSVGMAQWLRISGLASWKSSGKWGGMYTRQQHPQCPLHYYTFISLGAVVFKLIGDSARNEMLWTHAKGCRTIGFFVSQFRLQEQYGRRMSSGMEE